MEPIRLRNHWILTRLTTSRWHTLKGTTRDVHSQRKELLRRDHRVQIGRGNTRDLTAQRTDLSLTRFHKTNSYPTMAETATSHCCNFHDYLSFNDVTYYDDERGDEPYLFRSFAINDRKSEVSQIPSEKHKFILQNLCFEDVKCVLRKRKRS